jgi:hypothetical protein
MTSSGKAAIENVLTVDTVAAPPAILTRFRNSRRELIDWLIVEQMLTVVLDA